MNDQQREALIEIRDRLKDHPVYQEMSEEEEGIAGGDAAEFSYLVRIADAALSAIEPAQAQQAMKEHKQGCEALGGYGHGVGPCDCGFGARMALDCRPSAAPPAPVLPLSESMIEQLMAEVEQSDALIYDFARAIERAHGITEPGAGGE